MPHVDLTDRRSREARLAFQLNPTVSRAAWVIALVGCLGCDGKLRAPSSDADLDPATSDAQSGETTSDAAIAADGRTFDGSMSDGSVVDGQVVVDDDEIIGAEQPATSERWLPAGPPAGPIVGTVLLASGTILAASGESTGAVRMWSEGGRVYRSTDGGDSFQSTFSVAPDRTKHRVIVGIETNATRNRVFVAVENDGVWQSDDDGRTFSRVTAVSGVSPRLIATASSGNDRFYLNARNAFGIATLYRWDSAGSFVDLGQPDGVPWPAGIAVGSNPNTLYTLSAEANALAVSENAGGSWTLRAFPDTRSQGSTDSWNVYADPGATGHLVVVHASGFARESIDSGQTWADIGPFAGWVRDVHFDGDRIWFATDSGLMVKRGQDLTSTGTFVEPMVRSVTVDPDDQERVFVGQLGSGLMRSSDRGMTFRAAQRGLNAGIGVLKVTGSGNDARLWFLTAGGAFTTADGERWHRAAERAPTPCFADVAQSPTDANLFLLAANDDVYPNCPAVRGLLRLDLASGDVSISTDLLGRNTVSVAFDASGTAYAYTKRGTAEDQASVAIVGLFRSTDGGNSFTDLGFTSTDPYPSGDELFLNEPLVVSGDGTVYVGARDETGPAVWRRTSTATSFSTYLTDAPVALYRGLYEAPDGTIWTAGWNDIWQLGHSPLVSRLDGLTSFQTFVEDMAFSTDGARLVATKDGAALAAQGEGFSNWSEGLPTSEGTMSVAIMPEGLAFVTLRSGGLYRRIVAAR